MTALAVVLASAAWMGAPACSTGSSPPPTVTFLTEKADVSVSVEVAMDQTAIERGLMYRTQLTPYAGMIFVFPSEREHTFWMKNTYIPLDLIFIDSRLSVVGIVAEAEPMTESARSVGARSRFVVEVNGGFAAKHGIKTGTRVTFSGVPEQVAR